MKVLVILGHPRKDSYCAALANEYIKGAEDAGAIVKTLILSEMNFQMNVVVPSPQHQYLEEDILRAKELIIWSEHLVFVYPTWWGNVPALLKAFLDRTIMPGFAFRELQPDAYDKLLKGRSAQLITTMDTPLFVYKLFYGSPGTKALENATLKFCGIFPVRKLYFTPIKHSGEEQKQKWLQQTYRQGKALQYGVLSPWEKFWKKAGPWIQAIRLQFYPMTFFAYGIGAFAAEVMGYGFSWFIFLLGYVYLFLLEVAVVFSNDYYDYSSDSKNKNFSPFSGGSRVLVENLIPVKRFKKAINYILFFCAVLLCLIAFLSPAPAYILLPFIILLSLIALFYTWPPVKLSHRGLGEVTVGFTHSLAIILCGYIFQGGNITDSLPILISTPLFFSIVPAIIMSGMPDYEADKAAGKVTLVVLLGKTKATLVAILSVVVASLTAIFLNGRVEIIGAYGNEIILTSIHAFILIRMLWIFMNKKEKPERIDAIMGVSLLYIMWFVLIPFIRLA